MKKLALVLSCVACGGAATPSAVTVAAATPSAPAPPPVKRPFALELRFEAHASGDVRGIALDGGKLFVNVGGKLEVFDAHGPVAAVPHAFRAGDPLLAVGSGLFDPLSFESHTPKLPPGDCQVVAFSNDGRWMSAYCVDPSGNDAVHVIDARTGAESARFDEFHTAAPIRSGAITESGNFIFWSARASGAFEEIKSHVTGPMMSSHSVMSPNDDMLFTTVDRDWYTDDKTPARILDPKNGKTLVELDDDVDWAWFSPRGGLFAVRHSARWADMGHSHDGDRTSITLQMDASPLARVDGDGVQFSTDGGEVAIAKEAHDYRVYAIKR